MRMDIRTLDDIERIPLVEKVNLYSESGEEIKNYVSIRDKESKKVLAINSSFYKLVQHRDVARITKEVIDTMSKNYKMSYKIYGKHGKISITGIMNDISICIVNPEEDRVENIPIMVRVVNSYDRTASLGVETSLFREKCMNIIPSLLPRELKQLGHDIYNEVKSLTKLKTKHIGHVLSSEKKTRIYLNEHIQIGIRSAVETGNILESIKRNKISKEQLDELINELKLNRKKTDELKERLMKTKQNDGSYIVWDILQETTNMSTHKFNNPDLQFSVGYKTVRGIVNMVGAV